MSCSPERLDSVDFAVPSPGSPPGMSSSKSSKASSLHSFNSDDDPSVLADASHFEEIGLDDDAATIDASYVRDAQLKPSARPYPSEVRSLSAKPGNAPGRHPRTPARDLSAQHRPQPRNLSQQPLPKKRPSFPALSPHHFRDTSTRSLSTGIGPDPQRGPVPVRNLAVRSATTLDVPNRRRSPSASSPGRSLSPRDPNGKPRLPRRSSWQTVRERKSINDLEKEYDDDEDDDNIPEDFILDNVPLSPRPASARSPTPSQPASASTSPERSPKEKERVRSVGNGTPPVAVDSGSLRSPSWKSDAAPSPSSAGPPSPLKARAKSWTTYAAGLNAEALALTEKLEEHADDLDSHGIQSVPNAANPKPRVKSALAELPPLRRSNIMIDPLPVSKEKEAVLSRTRPSWLPPKDPAEERKHLREYQKLMASSIEAEQKREATRKEKERLKDKEANLQIHIWERQVLGRWDTAVREKRTRELWWKGIAPRCRGAVWSRAIGNELGLNEASFHAARARVREVEGRIAAGKATVEDERRGAWFDQILKDVQERTWPDLKIFQTGGPLHDNLADILRAYAMYRSDIGYLSGCNTIAALLLLNLPSPGAAFVALANILNRSLPISFYAADVGAKASAHNLVLQTLLKKSPTLHAHLTNRDLGIEPEEYLGRIFMSLFTQQLSLEECTRLWDVYVFEADSVLIRAAAALLLGREMALLSASTAAEVHKILEPCADIVDQEAGDQWMAKVREAGQS